MQAECHTAGNHAPEASQTKLPKVRPTERDNMLFHPWDGMPSKPGALLRAFSMTNLAEAREGGKDSGNCGQSLVKPMPGTGGHFQAKVEAQCRASPSAISVAEVVIDPSGKHNPRRVALGWFAAHKRAILSLPSNRAIVSF